MTFEIKALAALVILAGLALGLWRYNAHEQAIGAQAITAPIQAATIAASAADAVKAATVKTNQTRNLDDAFAKDTRHSAGVVALDDLLHSLRHPAAAGHPLQPGATASAAGPSQAAGLPAAEMVPADMYWGAIQMARDAAKYADCLRTGGELCSADYQALTP